MSLTSRPPTPDSPSSLRNATATIDDLTVALADFSRGLSPEPHNVTTCCCGKEECENSKAWAAFRAKLESRLVLSAEVGQALLERHEAFVRLHELAGGTTTEQNSSLSSPLTASFVRTEEQVDARVAELVRENAMLEKRLSRALVDSELSESSHQSALQELGRAQETITRLTAQNAKYAGLDHRLSTTTQEKEDIQQERDSAAQRARVAELRVVAFKDKCSKLQAQVTRLREDLESHRLHRQELSEEILSDARERLHQLQQLQLGHSIATDDSEVTKMLESLVADNEALKHDYAEVQNMLAETREDLRVLQEEVTERRLHDTPRSKHRFTDSNHSNESHSLLSPLANAFHVGTAPATSVLHTMLRNDRSGPTSDRRAASVERSDTYSPQAEHRSQSQSRLTEDRPPVFSRPQYAPSHFSSEIEDDSPFNEHPRANKSLFLLTRSRGVQTDGSGAITPSPAPSSMLAPSPLPRGFIDQMSTSSPHDGQSDSSSMAADGQATVVGILLERVATLTTRMMHADALTLTNRLKRQHLIGADVGHLSRSTVSGIIQELNTLRTHFRAFLEDDKITSTCTRKDLRGLFKLFKDLFNEMGQLRVTLNEVILDPTIAGRVSDFAMHPTKGSISASSPGVDSSGGSSGWMAPLTKLLGLPGGAPASTDQATRALSPPAHMRRGRPSRIVPKRQAALSATTTTVNVEFSGVGGGKAITSTNTIPERRGTQVAGGHVLAGPTSPGSSSNGSSSRDVMSIFAGAPRSTADPADPWVVIPKPPRSVVSIRPSLNLNSSVSESATLGRSVLRKFSSSRLGLGMPSDATPSKRLSRIVDAVIDQDPGPGQQSRSTNEDDAEEERDTVQDTLLERTLRPRGLSDSSIHTTFTNHGNETNERSDPTSPVTEQRKQSVLEALSRRVQSFRFASAAFSPTPADPDPSTPSQPSTPKKASTHPVSRSPPMAIPRSSHLQSSNASSSFLPSFHISPWAAVSMDPDAVTQPLSGSANPYHYGTSREDPFAARGWTREREL